MRLRLALLALGLLLVPSAEAGPGPYDRVATEIAVTFEGPQAVVEYSFEWPAASALEFRLHADAEFGDRDAVAEVQDAEGYFSLRRHTPRFEDAECRDQFSWIRVGTGSLPRVRSLETTFEGLEASVLSATPFTQRDRWSIQLADSGSAGLLHSLHFGHAGIRGSDLACFTPRSDTLHFYACCGAYWYRDEYVIRIPQDAIVASFTPASLAHLWNASEWRVMVEDRGTANAGAVNFTLAPREAQGQGAVLAEVPEDRTPSLAAFAISLGLLGILRPLWLLFSRSTRHSALEDEARAELFELVRNRPGICEADAARTLHWSRGRVSHHLAVLAGHGLVRRVASPYRIGFVVEGSAALPAPEATPTQQRILEGIRARPGSNQTTLMELLGLERHQASHGLRSLERLGLLRVERDGRHRKYFPA